MLRLPPYRSLLSTLLSLLESEVHVMSLAVLMSLQTFIAFVVKCEISPSILIMYRAFTKDEVPLFLTPYQGMNAWRSMWGENPIDS